MTDEPREEWNVGLILSCAGCLLVWVVLVAGVTWLVIR